MIKRDVCPACMGTQTDELLSMPFSQKQIWNHTTRLGLFEPPRWLADYSVENQLQYTILTCRNCQALFQRFALNSAMADRLYNEPARESGIPIASLKSLSLYAGEVLLLRLLLKADRPKVLDYGMGWGSWASIAQAFGCEVCGVEIKQAARDFCQGRGIKLLDETGIADGTFDFINVDQVLEHLVHPIETAKRLSRWLKPGGLILCAVPGHASLASILKRVSQCGDPIMELTAEDFKAIYPFVHLTLFQSRSLKLLARQAGLEVFHPPLLQALGTCTLWNSPRRWNQNLNLAFRVWMGLGTRLWFRRPRQ